MIEIKFAYMLTLADCTFSSQSIFGVVAQYLFELQLAWRCEEKYLKGFDMNRLDSGCPVQLYAEGITANRMAIWPQLQHTLWL